MPQLSKLAELVDGTIRGNQDPHINDAKTIARSGSQDITFATSPSTLESFFQSEACAAIVTENALSEIEGVVEKPVVVVEDAVSAFTRVVEQFRPELSRKRIGVSPAAHVSPTADIGDDVDIYPGAFVGERVTIGSGSTIFPGVCILENCVVGKDVKIYPNAVLYENTKVGDESIVHAGAVLGAFGFGYKSDGNGHQLSAQLGNVELGSRVEIGANTAIDRGTFDSTTVGDGTKMDDLVMVGHNCEIGKNNLLCSQVGIAGSCTTGDFVVMAGQVGIGDHLTIGNKVTLMAKSGLMHNVPDDSTFLGIPATPVREQMQILAVKAKLPELRKNLKRLGKRVAELESAQSVAGLSKEAA